MVAQIPTALPIGQEGERALTTAVEVARRLVYSRLAWLTLPTDNPGRMHLAAASEAPIDDQRGTFLRSPITLPASRRQRTANALRKVPADGLPTPIALLHDEEGDGLADLAPDNGSHISVPVLLDGGRFGLLHVAEPLGKRAFGDDERIALQAHANFIADHLALTAATRRIQELQLTVHQLQRTIIEAQAPQVRVLILSMLSGDEQTAGQELVEAIRTVMSGDTVLSPPVARRMVQQVRRGRERDRHAEMLSKREQEVLRLLADGSTSKEAARALGLRTKTVENHRARILAKLRVSNTAAAIGLAYQQGLLVPESISIPPDSAA